MLREIKGPLGEGILKIRIYLYDSCGIEAPKQYLHYIGL